MNGTLCGMGNPLNEPGSPSSAPLSSYLRRPGLLLPILAALTFVVYFSTLSFEFVWDDLPQIVSNPLIRSWHSLPRAFTSDLWFHTDRFQVYYRPLFVAWSTLNYSLFGLQTWGWHLGAVLLHMVASCMVYFLVRKLDMEHWTGALAALIFALHPVHIECASWVSAASDTLVTIFFILAFVAFLEMRAGIQQHRIEWRLLSLFLLACALLTKEMAVTFAACVAVYTWCNPRQDLSSGRWSRVAEGIRAALPYAAVTIAYLMVRKLALHRVGAGFDPAHSDLDVLLTLPLVLVNYMRIVIWPVGLTGLYYTPYIKTPGVLNFAVPLLLLSAFSGVIWYWAHHRKDSAVAFAGLWTILTLAPVLYLRTFGDGDFVRDRYFYLPSVGFIILAAKAIRLIPSIGTLGARAAQVAVTASLAVALLAACLSQQAYWANEVLVYYRGYSLYPQSVEAQVGLANVLSSRGATERALGLARDAVSKQPDFGPAYYVLAETYLRTGEKEAAMRALSQAIRLQPERVRSESGMAYLAGLLGRMGDYERALAACSNVLAREPDLYAALYNCGNVNYLAGNYSDAEKLIRRALEIAPDQAAPNYYLGRVYLQTGEGARAEFYLRRAVALDPSVFDYHYWLAHTLEQRHDLLEARREYIKVLELNPESADAKARLAAMQSGERPAGASQ